MIRLLMVSTFIHAVLIVEILILISFAGRAFAVGPKRILDLEDDLKGEFSGKVMGGFYETEMPAWDVKSAKMCAMMGI